VLLGADAAVQSREAPPAFSSVPLAEMSGSAVGGAEGEGVGTADADSSTGVETTDSYHGNGGVGTVGAGSGMAQESVPRSKTPTGPGLGPTNINIISPDSRFSKAALTPVSSSDSCLGFMNSSYAQLFVVV
jgi:hypothetical protein